MKPTLYRAIALGLLATPLMPQVAWATVAKPSLKTLKLKKVPRSTPPVTALRAIPDAPCYMETRYGLVDLSYMCHPQRLAQVTVVGTQRSGDRLTGQVRNDTSALVRYVAVNYAMPATADGVPQTAYTFANPVTLQPGQTAEFEIIQAGPVQITTVEWEVVPANLAGAY